MPSRPAWPLDRRSLLGGLAAAPFWRPSTGAAAERPNILFVSIDDLNDWTGVLGGHPQARTPHLDALAARGRSFQQAHCHAPACNPSRTATLTGIAPHRSGVYSNTAAWWEGVGSTPTLPALLRASGYRTLGAGKLFHYGDRSAWDEYLHDPCAKAVTDDRARPRKSDMVHVDDMHWGPSRSQRPGLHPDEAVAEWVGEQLSRPHEAPFFLGCGFYKPHLAWYAPRRYFEALPLDDVILPQVPDDELDDIPPIGRRLAHLETHRKIVQQDAWRSAVRAYLAALAFVDDQLGRVLAALAEGPHADRTLVVVWSDHGWSLGEKFHWKKFALWEECTRVPLVFAGPGIAPGPCERVVGLLDVYPTLARICGSDGHDRMDGTDLGPLLRDPTAAWDRPLLTTQGGGHHAIRTDRWRYIRYSDGEEELYDRRVDPGEHRNLADTTAALAPLEKLRPLVPQTVAPAVSDVTRKCRPPLG